MNQVSSQANIKAVIHTDAENVLSSLSEGSDGIFQRDSIVAEQVEAGEGRRVILWTFKHKKAGKIVEFLLRMTVVKEKGYDGGYVVNLNSVKHHELPMVGLEKLASLKAQRISWKGDVVEGFMKDCVLTLRNVKYGQSQFILNGTAFAFEALEEGTGTRLIRSMTTTIKSMPRSGLGIREKLNLTFISSIQAVLDAIEGAQHSIFKQFENSARVDEERHRCTIGEIDEEKAGQLSDPQEKAYMEEAKKMLAIRQGWKCVSQQGFNPIRISKLKKDDDSVPWCKAEAVVHTSAKRLLAYLLNFDSIERTEDHSGKHGMLPRHMHVCGEGGASDIRHLFYCVKVPNALRTRRLEVRAVWEKDKNDGGHGGAVYRFAWCPAFELSKSDDDISRIKAECGFGDGNSFLANSVFAKTRGIYELREVAENVTELIMVRHDELGGNMPATVKDINLTNAVKTTTRYLQKKYERNEKVVDSEMRQALAETMRRAEEDAKLTAEQEEIFRNLDDLKASGKGWSKLKSPTPDIRMWMKYNQQRKGERSIATGMAEGIVDCTAEEAAAFFYQYCSNERTRVRSEEGELAHLELKASSHDRLVNENIYGTVRRVPFPLTKREFVMKHIWRVNKDDESVSVGVWPAADVVDYGRNMGKTVRGAIKGLFTAKNISKEISIGNQCKVTHYMKADAGGFLPAALMNLKLSYQLMGLKRSIDKFSRDNEVSEHHCIQVHRESISIADFLYRSNRLLLFLKVDNEALANYVDIIRNERQVYSSSERESIRTGRKFYERYRDESGQYKILKSPYTAMEIKAVHVDGDSLMTGIGVVVVDADVATCLAYEFKKDSRAALSERKNRKLVDAAVHKLNDHSHLYLSVRDVGVRGLFNREFRVKGVWQVFKDGTALLAYEDTDDLDEEYPARRFGTVSASIQTACMFEPLPSVFGIPQTKVTFVARVDVKGIVPATFTNAFVSRYFSNLSKMRSKFERDKEIDKTSRATICKMMKAAKNYEGGNFSDRFTEIEHKVREMPQHL